jgi:hypothetical protein
MIGNGSTEYPRWVSGTSYPAGSYVVSPLTLGSYFLTVADAGTTDPSQDALWVPVPSPVYRRPVPLPYTQTQAPQFAVPALVTRPTDIRITPMLNANIDTDPIVIIQGSDALPITVLGIAIKYDVIGQA